MDQTVTASLQLIVIRSADIERSRQFYTALGLQFTKEKHGTGVEHYACEIGSQVFEIYPSRKDARPEDSTMLGFAVSSVDAVASAVTALGMALVKPPADSPRGRRAVLSDPDGRRIEITE